MNVEVLDNYYRKYNRREYVHPDPLEFLYNYNDVEDREIVGLITSSLAYGRVQQILKSSESVLKVMGNSPRMFLEKNSIGCLSALFKGFKHRFATEHDLIGLLSAIKIIVDRYDSLSRLFLSGYSLSDKTILPALSKFAESIQGIGGGTNLISAPSKGSACKRLNLFLRWMVRSDEVDPGGWSGVKASKLLIPLDTHMYNIGRRLGFTKRRQANLRAALEVTEAFSKINKNDPVKYDFALTRLGIRTDTNMEDFFLKCGV